MDELNPKFTWLSPVHFDELDPMQMLHNARFPAHVERATAAWFHANGRTWNLDVASNPDQFHVVRELRIEYLNPLLGPGSMRIDLWVEHLGKTSCVYGFLCSSSDGKIPYARGARTVVKVDPASKRPIPWTDHFRNVHTELLKNLPAYA
ncbi:MAG TPA: hotdog domain-containing protein [Thermoanaerobaculia bacterium]|nr:hotdog domain-containing protein [Thermoanaerobaculia bacterium]